jgi:hypothetical protein
VVKGQEGRGREAIASDLVPFFRLNYEDFTANETIEHRVKKNQTPPET